MKYFDCDNSLTEKHHELKKIIRKSDKFDEAKRLFLEIHAALHCGAVTCNASGSENNEIDELFADLTPQEFAALPSPKGETIAWAVWHLARIEDMTMNVLVENSKQLFDKSWKQRMNTAFTDTGVAMSSAQIMQLSAEINTAELLAYRNAAGKCTREIVAGLSAGDMKRKVSRESINKIRKEGGTCENSEWLLEYWGGKDIAGLLLMPPTRHLMLHLNDCFKWKEKIRKTKEKK
jgi:hypothetical protein